jgi:hypothetical protein
MEQDCSSQKEKAKQTTTNSCQPGNERIYKDAWYQNMCIVTFLYVLAEKVSDYHRIFFHSKIPPINKQRKGFLAHVQSDNESHNDEGMHLPEVPRINS